MGLGRVVASVWVVRVIGVVGGAVGSDSEDLAESGRPPEHSGTGLGQSPSPVVGFRPVGFAGQGS